jgi:hypothetical protein
LTDISRLEEGTGDQCFRFQYCLTGDSVNGKACATNVKDNDEAYSYFAGKFCGIFGLPLAGVKDTGKACFVGAMDTGKVCLIDIVDVDDEYLTGVLGTVGAT